MQKLLMAWFCISFVISAKAQDQPKHNTADSTVYIDSASEEDIKNNALDDIPVIALNDDDFRNSNNQIISSQLSAGRDAFYSAASFNFNLCAFGCVVMMPIVRACTSMELL